VSYRSNARKPADPRVEAHKPNGGERSRRILLRGAGAITLLLVTARFISAFTGSGLGWAELGGVTLMGLVLGFWFKGWAFPLILMLWGMTIGTLAVDGQIHDSDTTEAGLVILFGIVYLTPACLGAAAGALLRANPPKPPGGAITPSEPTVAS
jgi:hypothetical protein